MNNNFIILGAFLFFFFILITIIIIMLCFVPSNNDNNNQPKHCEYDGPIPCPQPEEVIGAAQNVTLKSTTSNSSFTSPCFVYFTNDMTYEVTTYGIRLPVGVYNIYVQYLSYAAVDGDILIDRLFRTENIGFNFNTTVQKQIGTQTAVFENNQCLTTYQGVQLNQNGSTLRIEAAIKSFPSNTLKIDQVEILFQKLLL